MTHDISIVFDCADVDKVSRFWLGALHGYDYPGSDPNGPPGSPPSGFNSWEEWADAHSVPQDQRHRSRTIIDTTGKRPDIFFMAVPEGRTVKNRVHLDIRVSRGLPPEQREAAREAEADRLLALGAELVERVENPDGTAHLVLRDVEGNEFCVV